MHRPNAAANHKMNMHSAYPPPASLGGMMGRGRAGAGGRGGNPNPAFFNQRQGVSVGGGAMGIPGSQNQRHGMSLPGGGGGNTGAVGGGGGGGGTNLGVTIRLHGLPLTASSADIRKFFSGTRKSTKKKSNLDWS